MLLCLVLIFTFSAFIANAAITSPCGDDSWIAYKDEKCVKLFKSFETRYRAEEICNEQGSRLFPSLVIIRSAAEQTFLNEYVFNSSDSNNVWIGARRLPDSVTEFDWSDGSTVDRFTNWAIGHPSNDVRRPCVHMRSELSRSLSDMQWIDVSCTIGDWFLCQKLQAWPIEQFQQVILSTRRELQHSVDSCTKQMTEMENNFGNQMTETRNSLTSHAIQLRALQENPVPVGFIYVQLPNQPEPKDVWVTVEWTEITSEYAGLFFRVLGGASSSFGTVQEENSPRLTSLSLSSIPGSAPTSEATVSAQGVAFISTGGISPVGAPDHWGVTFRLTTGEVRPRNQAIRIWRRI